MSAVISLNTGRDMKYYEISEKNGYKLPTLIHPTAYVSPDAVIKPGCIIRTKAVISRYASLGKAVADLETELAECMAKRKATQPLNMPNAGSTFKRLDAGAAATPTQVAPGYYIEQAGLKGYRIGGAEVSTLHANFIVNAGSATAQDIKSLSEYVQSKVAEKFGIKLHREIILLGEFE